MILSKKKTPLITVLLLVCALLLGGCQQTGPSAAPVPTAEPEPVAADDDAPSPRPDDGTGVPDECYPADGLYPVAMVTDGGEQFDGGVNESLWRGVKTCAFANGAAYKCYIPDGGGEEELLAAMLEAAQSGAQIAVCCGNGVGGALARAAAACPEVKWVYIDGAECRDAAGQLLENSAGIAFDELFRGYLAGWAAVKDGYTRLGFSGAGGGEDSRCCRCGYGFVQGANAAAAQAGVEVQINYTWLYGASFSSSEKLEALLESWYQAGTELVLPCGGEMYCSAMAAAERNGGHIIALDADSGADSETALCTVVKNYDAAAYRALSAFFEGRWESMGGVTTTLGLADGAVSLSTGDDWRFESFTPEDYQTLLSSWAAEGFEIDGDWPEAQGKTMEELSFSNAELSFFG